MTSQYMENSNDVLLHCLAFCCKFNCFTKRLHLHTYIHTQTRKYIYVPKHAHTITHACGRTNKHAEGVYYVHIFTLLLYIYIK